jgi:hypothetical protein
MEIIHSEMRNGYRIEIIHDEDPQDPRGDDNLGTMVCKHRRYTLGDKDAEMPEMETVTSEWVAFQLHLYDHSGITIRTRAFTDIDPQGWDSGMVGMIFASPEKIRKEYNLQPDAPISPEIIEQVRAVLEQEVKTYDQFLRGLVWGFRVMDGDDEKDSCWGFFQNEAPDAKDSYVLTEAREVADALPKGNPHTVRKIADRYKISHGSQALVLVSYLRCRTDERAKKDAEHIEAMGDWDNRALDQLMQDEEDEDSGSKSK